MTKCGTNPAIEPVFCSWFDPMLAGMAAVWALKMPKNGAAPFEVAVRLLAPSRPLLCPVENKNAPAIEPVAATVPELDQNHPSQ